MTTETTSNKAGAAWNVDFRKSGTRFEVLVTDADTQISMGFVASKG
jgi:hypothetical protein